MINFSLFLIFSQTLSLMYTQFSSSLSFNVSTCFVCVCVFCWLLLLLFPPSHNHLSLALELTFWFVLKHFIMLLYALCLSASLCCVYISPRMWSMSNSQDSLLYTYRRKDVSAMCCITRWHKATAKRNNKHVSFTSGLRILLLHLTTLIISFSSPLVYRPIKSFTGQLAVFMWQSATLREQKKGEAH